MKLESRQRRRGGGWAKVATILMVSALGVLAGRVAAGGVIIPRASVLLTGIVSDSICGSDHGIAKPRDAECTRSCVALGAHYTLMVGRLKVGKKMYFLHGHESDLDRFAGKEVSVKGREIGRDMIFIDEVTRSYGGR